MLILALAVCVPYCEKQVPRESESAQERATPERTTWLARARVADSLAELGDARGYTTLYEIAAEHDGEAAEYAIESLHYLLYSHTAAWIAGLSEVDSAKLKSFLDLSKVATAGWEDEEKFAPGYNEKIRRTLDTLICNQRQEQLKKLIIRQLEEE